MLREVDTSGKGLFLFFAIFGLVILMTATTLLWWLVSPQLHHISKPLAILTLTLLRLFYLVVLIGIVLVLLTAYTPRNFLISQIAVRLAIMILYPVALWLGKLFGFGRDRMQESFVHVNNSFIQSMKGGLPPERVLILLPHCLQHTSCSIRITIDINKCRACGRCTIGDLTLLAKKYKVPIAVATGGTLARRIVIQNRPKFIIAVACERDLVSGIQDTFPIPVYGVFNDRPEGPCINTRVAVERVEQGIRAALGL